MKINDIDTLLDKYFEGETSLHEEEILRTYFTGNDVADKHKQYCPIFSFFAEMRTEEDKVSTSYDVKKHRKLRPYIWVGVAACIMLLIGGIVTQNIKQAADTTRSIAYVDGKRISDTQAINTMAMESLSEISEMDEDAVSSQIDILNSFTE